MVMSSLLLIQRRYSHLVQLGPLDPGGDFALPPLTPRPQPRAPQAPTQIPPPTLSFSISCYFGSMYAEKWLCLAYQVLIFTVISK